MTDYPNPYDSPAEAAGTHVGQPLNSNSTLATVSMVTGIIGVVTMIPGCCCGLFYIISIPCAIAAVTTGLIARSQISAGTASGDGMALAGLICGGITLGLCLLSIVLVFVVGIGPEIIKATQM